MINNKEDLLKDCKEVFNSDGDDRVLSFLDDVRNYCEDTKDEITFTAKEVEIFRNNNRLDFYRRHSNYEFIQMIENKDNENRLIDAWKMTTVELQDFKSKLEKFIK